MASGAGLSGGFNSFLPNIVEENSEEIRNSSRSFRNSHRDDGEEGDNGMDVEDQIPLSGSSTRNISPLRRSMNKFSLAKGASSGSDNDSSPRAVRKRPASFSISRTPSLKSLTRHSASGSFASRSPVSAGATTPSRSPMSASRRNSSFGHHRTSSDIGSASDGVPSAPPFGVGGTLGTVGGFTSNLSRKSQNFRHSIAKHSGGALARLTRQGGMDDSDRNPTEGTSKMPIRRYRIGDPVLISNVDTGWIHCVNRFGYPPGAGNTPEEKQGPYLYVLGTVKTIHYEENAVFYTVTRVDTGGEVRGDPDFMEPILNKEGEEAARAAASNFAKSSSQEDADNDTSENAPVESNERAMKVVEDILEVLLLPAFLLYDLFVLMIGARLFRYSEIVFGWLKKQARSFLNGMKPYECTVTVTLVNLVVVCSIWFIFIDQVRLAFFPSDADYAVAVINFVIWCILSLELAFEVFIRPEEYNALIESDKAFMPTTVRFISGAHLLVEAASLAFFVPEFLCLFQSDLTCDDRPSLSFVHAAILATSGRSRVKSFAGRLFYVCIQLRVFGLVRHWKNMWLNTMYLKREKQKRLLAEASANLEKSDSDKTRDDTETSRRGRPLNLLRLKQKERNVALINASNIGTALMVTNSYRALMIVIMILGILPIITLICFVGVVDTAPTEMIKQLQNINVMARNESDSTCAFLVRSVEYWAQSWEYEKKHYLITTDTPDLLVSVTLRPARCQEEFESLVVGDLMFEHISCSSLEDSFGSELDGDLPDDCIIGILEGINGRNLRSIAQETDLRRGNIQMEHSLKIKETVIFRDGTSVDAQFQVSACFNQTRAIESSALASFFLQFCLLVTVIGGLSVLRRDAEDLVLGPLRSMLKIVARYARNPLAQAGAEIGRDNQSVLSDSESSASSGVSDGSEGDGLGTYETEQLITAVAKITDLLRKCWGVAGADIISTNLASREGALAEVFNPTVPGKSVYALFAFAAINGFDHALRCLRGDVMILINDVARVLHDEVYRWGFGDSGQCNKNLGSAFLMVFRIGLVKEVVQKLEEATRVVFSTSDAKKSVKKKTRLPPSRVRSSTEKRGNLGPTRSMTQGSKTKNLGMYEHDAMIPDAMKLSLQSLPGISTFTDRAVIGMLKSFAGIHRDNKLRGWSRDFRLSAGVGAFEVNMIFGMDAGWAVEGAVGSEYKIDATYLSPHVNMASRMMSACKHYGVTLLLSEAVQELMSDAAKNKLRNVDRVTVKGSVRIQKIFTFDARHKGADFFLFSRSDDLADIDAEQYIPSIWNTDQDLQAMRHHVTDDFESEFNAGMKSYYAGDWPAAIRRLETANEIMVDAAMEEGYLHDEMDDTPDRKELYRNETSDGPSSYLVHFMKSKGGVAPEGWAGWHPLLSK